EVATANELSRSRTPEVPWLSAVSFSADGRRLAVGGSEIHIWDIAGLRLERRLPSGGSVSSLRFLAGGVLEAWLNRKEPELARFDVVAGRELEHREMGSSFDTWITNDG